MSIFFAAAQTNHYYICRMAYTGGISVVIPNYNGETLLPQILPTVFAALQPLSVPWEIIVSDDCSTDNSIAILRNQFTAVKLISNDRNEGFSVTANRGIRTAQYDWVLLLNSDVKLEPDYFIPLLKYTERAGVFGVMGRIIGWDDAVIQDGAKYPYFHGLKIKTSGNYLLQEEEEMKTGIYSMYVSGANAFINRSVFLAIGGFNELFSPFYVEDFELSVRAWRLGHSCYYDHFAVCRHRVSTTIKSTNKKKRIKKIYNRNKMYLHAIHLGPFRRFWWFGQLILEVMGNSLIGKSSYQSSFRRFLNNYSTVKQSRRQLKEIAGDRKLLSLHQVVDFIEQSLKGKKIRRF